MADKNMALALIFSFLITGAGNIYNGLEKRGLVEFFVGIFLTGSSWFFSSMILRIIGIIWFIYVLYDTYQCTNAIANNQPVPPLLTKFNLE